MAEMITVKMKFDGESQHGAHVRHMWRRQKLWLILRSCLCIAAIATGAFLMEPTGGSKWNMIAGMMVTIGAVGFLRPMIWQMWMERELRKHPAYGTAVEYVFTEKGIKMTGAAGNVEIGWQEIYDVCLTAKGMLIYQTKQLYMWIPAGAFSKVGDMDQVREMWSADKGV